MMNLTDNIKKIVFYVKIENISINRFCTKKELVEMTIIFLSLLFCLLAKVASSCHLFRSTDLF